MILSIYPGIDLLGRSFEDVGYSLLRGPDKVWGGDNRSFHVRARMFEGVIGGPPCVKYSRMRGWYNHQPMEDLIEDFVRVVNESKPKWVIMENVQGAKRSPDIPKEWFPITLRDWDCGGFTYRRRTFWIYPSSLIMTPPKRPGKPEYSVLKTSWKAVYGRGFQGHTLITIKRACELQGFPELYPIMKTYGRQAANELMGNGVPRAMGHYIAENVKRIFGVEE